jgi:hypothetical protein
MNLLKILSDYYPESEAKEGNPYREGDDNNALDMRNGYILIPTDDNNRLLLGIVNEKNKIESIGEAFSLVGVVITWEVWTDEDTGYYDLIDIEARLTMMKQIKELVDLADNTFAVT